MSTVVSISEHEADELTILVDGVPITLPVREWWENCTRCVGRKANLTPYQVMAARIDYHERGVSTRDLARRLGCGRRHVVRIVWRDCYEFVPMPRTLRPGKALDARPHLAG